MATFEAGTRIGGRYRLLRKLGEGGMGVVWSARNESTDRDFALKLMLPEATAHGRRIERFLKEAKAAGRLRHRSIVEVYDLGVIDEPGYGNAPYLVMELLDGEPLDVVLRRLGKLPAGTALRVVGDVARALEVAHKHGIVHRDLKPANLFLHRSLDGGFVPKVLDFGVSKLIGRDDDGGPADAKHTGFDVTLVGAVVGSPAYMSPEQASGEPDLDGRSDLWSLGVILYRSLSGALPFSGASFEDLAREIHRKDPRPLGELVAGLPREAEALVHQCLAKDRAARFQSARALGDAIDELLERFPLPTLELSRVITLASLGADLRASDRFPTRVSHISQDASETLEGAAPVELDTEPLTRAPAAERSGIETRELAPTAPSIDIADIGEIARAADDVAPLERAPAAPTPEPPPSSPPRAALVVEELAPPRSRVAGKRSRSVPIALGALAIASLVAIAIVRGSGPRPAVGAEGEIAASATRVEPLAYATMAASVTSPSASAVPSASTSSSARAESAPTRTSSTTRPTAPVAIAPRPLAPAKTVAKPSAPSLVHEGITHAGF